MTEITKNLIEIQDYLVPMLDTYEQAIYHYILRHTYLVGNNSTFFSTKRAQIGFGSGAKGNQPSESSRSKKLRSLEKKGAIKILERSHRGILVSIVLPKDIQGLINLVSKPNFNLDELDFYKDRRLLVAILEREGYRCFYTGKKITSETCYLDHLNAQTLGGDNSFKNIVATSFDANSMKNNKSVDDFIRQLYKDEIISLNEFNNLKKKIIQLQNGELTPDATTIQKVLNN